MSEFVKIESIADLDSSERILVFKHSRSCPISLNALREVQAFMAENTDEIPIALIDVFSDRSFSTEVAAHLGLRHESPQIIYLEKGKMLWDASHLSVSSEKIQEAVTS